MRYAVPCALLRDDAVVTSLRFLDVSVVDFKSVGDDLISVGDKMWINYDCNGDSSGVGFSLFKNVLTRYIPIGTRLHDFNVKIIWKSEEIRNHWWRIPTNCVLHVVPAHKKITTVFFSFKSYWLTVACIDIVFFLYRCKRVDSKSGWPNNSFSICPSLWQTI